MKSKERIDREIAAVAEIWNQNGSHDPYDMENSIASAIYHTLAWCMGKQVQAPSAAVTKTFETAKGEKS